MFIFTTLTGGQTESGGGSAPRTTVELLRCQRGHRSALQAAGVVAGGRGLSVARLGVLLEEVGQPQQLAVAVQGVGIQSAANTHTQTHARVPGLARQRKSVELTMCSLAGLRKGSLAASELKVAWHGPAQSKQCG